APAADQRSAAACTTATSYGPPYTRTGVFRSAHLRMVSRKVEYGSLICATAAALRPAVETVGVVGVGEVGDFMPPSPPPPHPKLTASTTSAAIRTCTDFVLIASPLLSRSLLPAPSDLRRT